MPPTDSLCICYNLVDHKNLPEIPPLPEAYIVPLSEDKLRYVEKLATPETLSSFDIPYQKTPHESLLEICSSLKIKVLEQRFRPARKKKNFGLSDILKDAKNKKIITDYIHQKLAGFYTLLIDNKYPITLNAQRKDPFQVHKLSPGDRFLHPILEFTKTDDGIDYAFTLKIQEKVIIPQNHTIQILLNQPSWIIIDKVIYHIKKLNANKLKPFFQKEKITIAKKHIRTYLDKVIIPVIKNVDVIANGFEIVTHQNILSYRLEIVQDFINKHYVIQLSFRYDQATFDYHSARLTSSNVYFNENEEIKITQTKRNPEAEKEITQRLASKGLLKTPNKIFETKPSDDPMEIFNWLQEYRTQLEEEGFELILPKLEDRTLTLDAHHLEIQNKQKNDWFDLKAIVHIGTQKIPFSKFIKNIKENNRLFIIDDQSVFIIPQAWMTRFNSLINFAKINDESILINKSHYTILKDIIPPEELEVSTKINTAYQPSDKLNATLRPYQKEGVEWLVQHQQNELGACLADDMGLGKTLQTIATLVHTKEQLIPTPEAQKTIRLDLFSDPLEIRTYLKALIVLPASLVFNWTQEIVKFAPHLTITKYVGADRKKIIPYIETYDIILTTYTTLSKDIAMLQKTAFTYLITDESQQIKNKESNIFKAINKIQATHKVSLSGTPIENSLSDLWSQMECINPGMLGNYTFFKEYFKLPIEKHQDQQRIKELKTLIEPFILRRTKEQVAKDLPELSEQTIYTEMLADQEQEYESQKSAARNFLLGIDNASTTKIHIINTLTKLRQLANHPKLLDTTTGNPSGKFQDVTSYLETLVAANKKVLVFSSFVSHLQLYQEWCDSQGISYVSLTGQTKSSDREKVVDEFQENDSIPLFFISIKAGGVGLNLTKASYVVLLDPWWNPFVEKQAIARSHRIGQKNNVMVTRFITKNTIEEKILQLQNRKKNLSEEIIAVDAIPDYIQNDLEALLH